MALDVSCAGGVERLSALLETSAMAKKRRERVTRVIDGDTFLTASRKRPIRLAGLDAPEKGRPGAAAATAALRALIGGQFVTVNTKARDKYGRPVADVNVGGRSVNKAMRARLR